MHGDPQANGMVATITLKPSLESGDPSNDIAANFRSLPKSDGAMGKPPRGLLTIGVRAAKKRDPEVLMPLTSGGTPPPPGGGYWISKEETWIPKIFRLRRAAKVGFC